MRAQTQTLNDQGITGCGTYLGSVNGCTCEGCKATAIIQSAPPARSEAPSTFVPMPPEKKAAMRAYANKIVQDRIDAGLYPDGRVNDMAKYSEHLRNGGQL
jgi:hypothetical protein